MANLSHFFWQQTFTIYIRILIFCKFNSDFPYCPVMIGFCYSAKQTPAFDLLHLNQGRLVLLITIKPWSYSQKHFCNIFFVLQSTVTLSSIPFLESWQNWISLINWNQQSFWAQKSANWPSLAPFPFTSLIFKCSVSSFFFFLNRVSLRIWW